MKEISSSPISQQDHDFICPITLDVCREPVLASDGYVYERAAIIQWIEQQGTSPLTRLPLNVKDLRSKDHIKQLCQSNSLIYSCENSIVSISSLSMTQLEGPTNRSIACKQYCNVKRILLMTIATILIISPLITATIVILFILRSNSISEISTSVEYPNHHIHSLTTYKLPNNCILSKFVLLFSWNDIESFNYTYYSKLYKAVSTRTIITFVFRHNPSDWCLDDVSVKDISSNVELVTNGHFENNPPDGFIRCNSYGYSSISSFLTSTHTYNGKRSFCDGSLDLPDCLSQILNTKIGQLYRITFWLQNLGDKPNSAQVVISN